MLNIGWKAGTEQYPPGELLDCAIAADEAGFDSVAASDHFHPWAEKGQACFAWSWLGAAAARCKNVMLGTGLTCPILRYHPAIIAQAAATISCIAPKGFFLGVGTGEALNEYSATGQWPSYKERQDRLREAIQLMRELWLGEEVTFRGLYYQTRRAKLYSLPKAPIPIYISAMVPNSAGFAGKYGDGLLTVGGQEADTYGEIMAQFEAGAREADKEPSEMPRMVEIAVAVTDDDERAIQYRKQYWAGTFVPALFTEQIYTPKLSEENGSIVGSDAVRKSVCISADPSDHVKFAQRYVDMGFDHLAIHSAGPDQRHFIEEYGGKVLPQLRRSRKNESKAAA